MKALFVLLILALSVSAAAQTAASQERRHPDVELVHFTLEAGKICYFLIRGIGASGGYVNFSAMVFGAVECDEALYLIASDPMGVSGPQNDRTYRDPIF